MNTQAVNQKSLATTRIKKIYDGYVKAMEQLRKKHLNEFSIFVKKIEEEKIKKILKSIIEK